MLKKYNPEHNEYVNYIPLESYAEMKEEIDKLNERLKNTPVMEKLPFDDEQAEVIDINNLAEIEPYFADKNINMDAPVNNRMASFLLVAAYFTKNIEVIKFLVKRGSSINKTDVFGFNAVMSVVLNENMEVATKIKTIEFLADNGCDINWMTCLGETALTMALAKADVKIANFLLDKGAVLYKK